MGGDTGDMGGGEKQVFLDLGGIVCPRQGGWGGMVAAVVVRSSFSRFGGDNLSPTRWIMVEGVVVRSSFFQIWGG